MRILTTLFLFVFVTLFVSCSNDSPENLSTNPLILSKKGGNGNGHGGGGNPPPPSSLTLRTGTPQIAVSTYDGDIRVWSWSGNTFQSDGVQSIGDWRDAIVLGDVDNDGEKELVTTNYYAEGHGRNRIHHLVLEIYEDGDNAPSRVSEDLIPGGQLTVIDLAIGDADNDGVNELAVVGRDYLQIFQDDGDALSLVWETSLDLNFGYSGTIADADNDGLNEVIYSSLRNGFFAVYNYLGNNTWGAPVISESVGGALDIVQVADVDGDGANEIIGGGNQSQLFVWESNNGIYSRSFTSAVLDGFTQGVAAGDFDGDGINEIAVGTAGETDSAYLFKFNGETYQQIYRDNLSASVNYVATGDLDNDGNAEFVFGSEGIAVYGWSGTYSQVYLETFAGEVSGLACK